MPVRAELGLRRFFLALLMIAALPALLATTAIVYNRPAPPPGPPAYNPTPLTRDEVLIALLARELQRSRKLSAVAPSLPPGPQLLAATFPAPLPTIVLSPRPEPYTLAEVRDSVPAAFETVGTTLLVKASIEVPRNSELIVEGTTTPHLRLLSTPAGFVTLIAQGGTLKFQGTTQAPLTVSTWDPATAAVDESLVDGRSFLLTMGGRMDISHTDIGYLGFGTGTSSGAAWRSDDHSIDSDAIPAAGTVTNSVLHHNWFGAYTFEATAMQWIGNTFAYNAAYGFDPHDLSNDFLVERNVAHHNGRHGFIFSRGCDRNILRDNVAYNNRGHGFMIDDGRSEDTSYADAARLPSNNNQLVGNRAYNNDGSGIEIEGGTGTIVSGNSLAGNHVGVRVKSDASALVENNRITNSALAGVDVLNGRGSVRIVNNTVSGGWAGIALGGHTSATLEENTLVDASTPLAVAGQAVREENIGSIIGRVFRWNPLLVLWAAILGVPFVFGIYRLARLAAPRRDLAGALRR